MSADTLVAVASRAQRVVDIDDIIITQRLRDVVESTLPALMTSIAEVGLLYPVLVNEMTALVDGRQRLEALRRLGYRQVPIIVDPDADDPLQALRREATANGVRTQWTPVQAAAARRRMRELRARDKQVRANAPLAERRLGWSAEYAVAETGVSRSTMDRVDQITNIAEDPTRPVEVRRLAAEGLAAIDNGRSKVDPVLKTVRTADTAFTVFQKYPDLRKLPTPEAAIRMGAHLDSLDSEQREEQLATLRIAWADAKTLVFHHAFVEDEAARLSPAVASPNAEKVGAALTAMAAGGTITPQVQSSWSRIAEDLIDYGERIRAALSAT